MAFTIYKSNDIGSPLFYGTTGSYVALLDACLVNGYGSKPGAGWTKPIPNTGSGTFASSMGCWKQPSGSQFTLVINDNRPNITSLGRECWATGWELLFDLSASVTNSVGSGSGQFPTPAQLLTTGHVVVRKSTTSDSSSLRQWIVVADSSSFYSFIATGDTAGMYYGFGFGDIYSFKTGSTDNYKCVIMGRNTENAATGATDGFDLFTAYTTPTIGNFIARTHTGIGTSSVISKHGDGVKGSATSYLGNIPYPNAADNTLYLSPVWVVENNTVRGQLRGLYQSLHPVAQFTDGQIFSGSLDYSGKTFFVIKTTPNSGIYIVETSNTLLTNSN